MLYGNLESLKDSVMSREDKTSEQSKKEELFFSRVLDSHEGPSTMSMLVNLQKTNDFLQQKNKNIKLENKKLTQELNKRQTQCSQLNQEIIKIRSEFQKQKMKFPMVTLGANQESNQHLCFNEIQLREKIINLQIEIQRGIEDKQILKEVYMEARDNMIQQVSMLRIESSSKDRIIEQLKLQLKQKKEQLNKKQAQIENLIKKLEEKNDQNKIYIGKESSSSYIDNINNNHRNDPCLSCIQNSKNNIRCSTITSSSDHKRTLSEIQENNVTEQKDNLSKIEEQSNSQLLISKLFNGFLYSKDYYKLAIAQQKYKLARMQRQNKILTDKYEDQVQRSQGLEKIIKRYEQKINILAGKEQSYDILFQKQQFKIQNMIKMYDNQLENFKQIQNQELSKKWLEQFHSLQQNLQKKETQMKNMKQKYDQQIFLLKRKIRQMERHQKLIIKQSPRNYQKIGLPIQIQQKLQKKVSENYEKSMYNVKSSPQYIMLQKQLIRYKNLFKNQKLNHEKAKNYHEALVKMLQKAKKLGRKDSKEIVDDAINWVKRTSSQFSGDSDNNKVSRENINSNYDFDSNQTITPESPILILQNLTEKNECQNILKSGANKTINGSVKSKIRKN